jgi:hypothetical protein
MTLQSIRGSNPLNISPDMTAEPKPNTKLTSMLARSCLAETLLTAGLQVPMYSLSPRYMEHGAPIWLVQQVRVVVALHFTGADVL